MSATFTATTVRSSANFHEVDALDVAVVAELSQHALT